MIISATFNNYNGAKQNVSVPNSMGSSVLSLVFSGIALDNVNVIDTNKPALIYGSIEGIGLGKISSSYSNIPIFPLNYAGAIGTLIDSTNKHTSVNMIVDPAFVGGINRASNKLEGLVIKLFSEDLVAGEARGITQVLTFDSSSDVTGTLNNKAIRSNATGVSKIYDYGLSLPQVGSVDYLSLVADTDFDDTVIVEAMWVSIVDWANTDGYIVDYSAGGTDGYYAYLDAGMLYFYVFDSVTVSWVFTSYDVSTLVTGYHLLCFQIGDALAGSVANIYVDGVDTGTEVVGTYAPSAGMLKYYGANDGTSDGLVCSMDEVTLWRGVNAQNIGDDAFAELYNDGIGTDNQGLKYVSSGGYKLPILPRYEFQFEDNQYDPVATNSRNKLQGTDSLHLTFQSV